MLKVKQVSVRRAQTQSWACFPDEMGAHGRVDCQNGRFDCQLPKWQAVALFSLVFKPQMTATLLLKSFLCEKTRENAIASSTTGISCARVAQRGN